MVRRFSLSFLFCFVGFSLACSRRSDCGDGAKRCEQKNSEGVG